MSSFLDMHMAKQRVHCPKRRQLIFFFNLQTMLSLQNLAFSLIWPGAASLCHWTDTCQNTPGCCCFWEIHQTFHIRRISDKTSNGDWKSWGKVGKGGSKKLVPVLTSKGKKTAFGALEHQAAAEEILTMGRVYGAASKFLTVSVDHVHTLEVFRLAFQSCNNMKFPALFPDTLLDAIEVGGNYDIDSINDQNSCIHGKTCVGRGSVHIPCGWSSLAEKATDNSVSIAIHYKNTSMT